MRERRLIRFDFDLFLFFFFSLNDRSMIDESVADEEERVKSDCCDDRNRCCDEGEGVPHRR